MRSIHVSYTSGLWLAVSPEAQTCKLCDFYRDGHCHRHAPTTAGWPCLEPNHWCGDFVLNRPLVRDMFTERSLPDGVTTCDPPNILRPEELE